MLYLLAPAFAADPALHDALLGRFHDHFGEASGEHGALCLTGLVKELGENWDLFSPAERAEMTSVLTPWKADLLDPVEATTPPPPPGGAATDTCSGQQATYRVTGANFAVEWSTSRVSESTAEAFLDALEHAYEVEVNELGWEPPANDGRYLMRVEISNQNYAGAYTYVERCGNSYVPYISAGYGSFSGGDWYETMALHEFNHAVQFSYGYGPEFWIWEATATYIEEQVLPGSNWWQTYVQGYSDNPEMAFSAESQSDYDTFYHMYGMAIWGFSLDEFTGDTDKVRQMWDWAKRNGGQYDLNIEEMTEGAGIDFEDAYADFVARNSAMEYREHRYFKEVAEVDSFSELPAEGESGSRTAPGGYGQNYIRFKKGAGDDESTLVVQFESDESPDFLLELIEVTDDEVVRFEHTVVEGSGSIALARFGENDVLLAVSPLKHNNNDEYHYSWSASLEEPEDTDIYVPPPEETTEGGESDDGGGKKVNVNESGCGCATGGSEMPWFGLLAGLAFLRRRSR